MSLESTPVDNPDRPRWHLLGYGWGALLVLGYFFPNRIVVIAFGAVLNLAFIVMVARQSSRKAKASNQPVGSSRPVFRWLGAGLFLLSASILPLAVYEVIFMPREGIAMAASVVCLMILGGLAAGLPDLARRLRRVHLSTVILITVLAGGFVGINVPPQFGAEGITRVGWPITLHFPLPIDRITGKPDVMRALIALWLDLLVAVILLAVAVYLLELAIRRRAKANLSA